MPEHLEAGTLNVHGIAGLLGALEYLEKTGIEMIYKRERELMHLFLEKIQGIPGLTLFGTDDLQQRVPTAALNIGSCDSGYVSDWLGYKLFFIFVLVAAIPAFLLTLFVPFTHEDKK